MNPAPLACWLLTATLLAAADAPQGDTPPRDPQPQVQRPQRDRANAQGGNNETPRGQRQGGQNGPIPAKPDFIPGNPGQEPVAPSRNLPPQFGNGQSAPKENVRSGNIQPQNQGQRRANALTPDEQHKLQETMEKLKENADLKEARELALKARKSAEEATRKEHELTEAAALKLDPSLAPIFEKMRATNNSQIQLRQGGSVPPTAEQIQAFREQMRDRAGEKAPARREEPAR